MIVRRIVSLCVLILAFYVFSENTADPDLWGHVLFGERMLHAGRVEKVEPFSWTARGAPWVNHETLAEAALAGAHRLAGGTGVFWLMTLSGLLTWGLALRMGTRGLMGTERAVAWGVAALAAVELSFGFAARPQIFTGLGLALLLWLIRQVVRGRWAWAAAIPLLFLVWINTHGGALVGLALLAVAAVACLAQALWPRATTSDAPSTVARPARGAWLALVLAVLVALPCLLANPWGADLLRWLVASVRWLRPEIEEWNPVALGWDHAPFFALLALAAAAFVYTRRPRSAWEIAVCAVLAAAACRSVRNTPLFALAALACVPPHAASALGRLTVFAPRLLELGRDRAARALATGALAIATAAMLFLTWQRDQGVRWTMAVPRARYPLAAVDFIQRHGLAGNLLVFFDWGELCLWELPACPVSIDGRLDTCYPRPLIGEHWKFYKGEEPDQTILDLDRADLALLPHIAGAQFLAARPGWYVVYADPLAVVMVRGLERFPALKGMVEPVVRRNDAVLGRSRFPDTRPAAPAPSR